MTERERLIKLIHMGIKYARGQMQDEGVDFAYGDVADYLLANGVIVPPVQVGQTVYVDYHTLRHYKSVWGGGEKYIFWEENAIPEYVECEVVAIRITARRKYFKIQYTGDFEEKYFDDECGYDYRIITDSICGNYGFSSIGKTVFLTKEDAEKTLKKRNKEK